MKKNVDRQKIIRRTNFKRPLQKCTLWILKIKDIRFYEKLKSSNPRQNQNNSDSLKSHIESKIPNISFEKMSKFRNEKFPRSLINAWKKENCKEVKFTRRSKARKAATLWSRSKRARRKVARNMWRRGGVSPPWERVSTHIMRAQGRTIRTRDTHAQTMARERESSNPLVCVCVSAYTCVATHESQRRLKYARVHSVRARTLKASQRERRVPDALESCTAQNRYGESSRIISFTGLRAMLVIHG